MRPAFFIALLGLLWTCASSAGDPRPSSGPVGTAEVGRVKSKSLVEASGLVASRSHAGIYWTHNDGGDGVLHAIRRDGSAVARVRVDEKFSDWEDIAVDARGDL